MLQTDKFFEGFVVTIIISEPLVLKTLFILISATAAVRGINYRLFCKPRN
jgi:hypothetical protein